MNTRWATVLHSRPQDVGSRPWLGVWTLILLVLQSSCATGLAYSDTSVATRNFVTIELKRDFTPVQVSDMEFREAFSRLVLEVPLRIVDHSLSSRDGGLLKASWHIADTRAETIGDGYARLCDRRGSPGDCFSLLGANPHGDNLNVRTRFALGLILALSPAVDAAMGVLRDFSAHAMTSLLTGLSLYLLALIAPEPLSKGLAAAMTLLLWGYLGSELWELISATGQLWDAAKAANTFHELKEASERYAQVLGPNTLRILILLATWRAGAKVDESMRGNGLPRFSQAVRNAASAGGIRLPAAASEAASVSVVEGRLALTLPAGAGALLAMQQDSGDGEGEIHHIATVKNEKSTLRGGPWTQRLKQLFDKADMSMEDPANKVRVPGHKGPHPREYHERIYRRLKDAVAVCKTSVQCREALTTELRALADQLREVGSELNLLVTQAQGG